jgi:hypothetical protein
LGRAALTTLTDIRPFIGRSGAVKPFFLFKRNDAHGLISDYKTLRQ